MKGSYKLLQVILLSTSRDWVSTGADMPVHSVYSKINQSDSLTKSKYPKPEPTDDDGTRELYLQGCTGLTIEGVIEAVKLHTKASHRLKNLAISGIYNVKTEDFEILCHLMGINQIQMKQGKKNYYHTRRELSAFKRESQPSIDVDICPKCGEIREVFDCPKDSCKRRMQQQQQQQQQKQVLMECCRGCFLCVPRCEECGICTKDEELGEAACADILCLNCWLKLPKCSFCNKAYCNQHAYNQQSLYPGGFLCSHCSFHATQSSHY